MDKKFVIKKTVVIEKSIKTEELVSHNEYLAFKIKELRKAKKISQEKFAEKLGLSRTSVTNIETGRQAVTMNKLFKICETLGVESKELLPF